MSLARSDFAPWRLPLHLICAATLLAGCCLPKTPATTDSRDIAPAPKQPPASIQYGRYTTVDAVPDPGERDLLLQIVDVSIPAYVTPTVGDALRYVLLRSGYRLCTERQEITEFDLLPLPAAHMDLGPLQLVDAMNVLVGPAWSLETDEATRVVCFSLHSYGAPNHIPITETRPFRDGASVDSDSEQRQ